MKFTLRKIEQDEFRESLSTLRWEYERYQEVSQSISKVWDFIEKELQKKFKGIKITKARVSKWAGVTFWTNKKELGDYDYYRYICDLDIIGKTNFRGSYINICNSKNGVKWILNNTDLDCNEGKIKFK